MFETGRGALCMNGLGSVVVQEVDTRNANKRYLRNRDVDPLGNCPSKLQQRALTPIKIRTPHRHMSSKTNIGARGTTTMDGINTAEHNTIREL